MVKFTIFVVKTVCCVDWYKIKKDLYTVVKVAFLIFLVEAQGLEPWTQ